MEWSNSNKYNSFNSYKGLTYWDNYKKIVSWWDEKDYLPPPIEVSLDPIALCNFNCYYCNSQRYLRDNPDEIPANKRLMSKAYMSDLVKRFHKWGVQGVCLGGGGDSLLNKHTWGMPSIIQANGIEVAVVTNGSMLHASLIRQLLYCRWVGFSVDAGDEETFKKIHGVDMFYQVVDNIKALIKARDEAGWPSLEISYKVLILPENADKIYGICEFARSLGVDEFHVRPVDLWRKDVKIARELNISLDNVKEDLEKCHELETDTFKVYTVFHKYNEDFSVKHDFKNCIASPLALQCCTDQNCYVCPDHRLEERFKLGSQKDFEKWWGSDKHRNLLKSIDPDKECSRCTWSEYNRQIEECVMEDGLCRSFP